LKIDLTPQAGFLLHLDLSILEVTTSDDIHFARETRRQVDMKPVLYEPDALPAETALYWNLKYQQASGADPIFHKMGLTFGLVLLPSLKVGKEFVKTHGHYHSTMPGGQIGFPEVYTHYYGELYLYMQRREPGSNTRLDDCVVFKMKSGRSIMIPPGYAHILINPSGGPALMGGLYSPQAVHDYEPIRQMAGGAYYYVEEDGLERAIPNSCYEFCPPLRVLEGLAGTRFAPPDDRRPLWSSLIEDPQRYAFINDPDAARLQFLTEDQTQ
jgi:glucose-6-phosphate isomerase